MYFTMLRSMSAPWLAMIALFVSSVQPSTSYGQEEGIYNDNYDYDTYAYDDYWGYDYDYYDDYGYYDDFEYEYEYD